MGVALALAGCSQQGSGGRVEAGAPPHATRRYGDVMTEVARRFERSGRAVVAGRWDLAAYDVGEIEEVFEQDIPTAEQPSEVHVDLRPIAQAFASTHPAALHQAIAAHDRAAFASAFAAASTMCNTCHAAAGKPFIEVPSVPGEPVPRLSPVGAPAVAPDEGPSDAH